MQKPSSAPPGKKPPAKTSDPATGPAVKKAPARPAVDQTAAFDGDQELHQDSTPPGGETEVFGGGEPADEAPAQDGTMAMDDAEVAAVAPVKKTAAAPAGKASTLGEYKLLKKLGQGGMGAVFKAHQASLDREVAVKVLAKELAAKPAFVQRFMREARVMAKLDHPNILRCFEVGNASGFHYISMEFVEGGSVENWLKKLGQFDIGDALCIVIAVARALEHAHEQGTIHRDIKPDNILLTKKGVIKVADLGLAKATDDDLGLTRTGTGAGTPIYMAPEQARDVKHVDGRCDIYALGVMLYFFLAGKAPFTGATLVEVIEAKEKGKFKPLRTFNGDVPERLDLIVDKMLATDPKLRFATCTEVVEELEALGLANESLSFFEGAAAASPIRSASATKTPAAPAVKTQRPQSSPAGSLKTGSTPPAQAEPKAVGDFWFWSFKDPKGKPVTKKLTNNELVTLVKSGSIDSKAQISRTITGGFRAIGTYPEFESHFRGKLAEKRAGKGADKYKSMLDQIEAEENRRQRWKGLRNFFGRFGSFVGLVMWLAVVAAVIAGGYYGFNFVVEKMR